MVVHLWIQNHFECPEIRTTKFLDNDRQKIAIISLIADECWGNAASAYGMRTELELGDQVAVR
jgi:hypothetical protein